MIPADLVGRVYGPVTVPVSPDAVAGFVAATGDDMKRWERYAPPGFAAYALFAVASLLVGDPAMAGHTRSLIHSEQEFSWRRPLAVDEALVVSGRVRSVRTRGPLHLVVLETEAATGAGTWLEGRSTFLLSADAAAAAAEEEEPEAGLRAAFGVADLLPLPAAGVALSPLDRSASRDDLVRYGVASGDGNLIHIDHGAARAAGLPGVVVHGLLVGSWLCQAAARYSPGPLPVLSLRARFRLPLRPAVAARVQGRVAAVGDQTADLELALVCDGAELVAATARVTR
jgi:acyl dehydratase